MTRPIPPLDLIWLLMETPTGTGHIGALMVFEEPPGRPAVVDEIVDAYRGFPPTPPFNFVPRLISLRPHFIEKADWDPAYHVSRVTLPSGSSYPDLLRLVADLHGAMLPHDRPLFRFWLIDGVPGERFAIYAKFHHSIVDGMSALRRVYQGLSTTADHTVPAPLYALASSEPVAPPRPLRARVTAALRTTIAQLRAVGRLSIALFRKVLAAVGGAQPVGSLPFFARRASINKPLTRGRGYATLSLPLDELRAVAQRFGATVNDVAAAVVDAGLHAYLAETGNAFADRLIAMCPVSLRNDGDAAVGTRVSAVFARLGDPGAAPEERIRQVAESLATAKGEITAMPTDDAMTFATGVAGLAGALSLSHLDRITRPVCNVVISNMPGTRETRYLNGARLAGLYPVPGLAASLGLNVTLLSNADQVDFGFLADTSAIADVAVLADHTLRAFGELKAAAANA
ncbi:MAG: wax ester/triacylglycerol synthase family O-acyltransferase [Mycolicibacterium sp.]|nr:wax ester/triacylglycerol synthase family O-acyltransferase [Mycobacterium sp.]MCB9416876.1 wax ester/triacylglycerol synthase family O-acyltransferase [Mycolicibacterium sp.]